MIRSAQRTRRSPSLAEVLTLVTLLGAWLGLALRKPRAALVGDGPSILEDYVSSSGEHASYHLALGPIAKLFSGILPGLEPRRVLEWACASCAALGLAALYATGRRLGLRAVTSGVLVAAVATTPSLWLYATHIEVHALQFASGALALWLAVAARERSARTGGALLATALFVTYAGHRSGVLLWPGLVLVFVSAPARAGTWRWAFAAAAWGCLAVWACEPGFGEMFFQGPRPRPSLDIIQQFWVGPDLGMSARELGLWLPGPVLLAAALLLARWRVRPEELSPSRLPHPSLTAGVFALPSLAFFLLFGVHSLGGYYLALLSALAFVASRVTPGLPGRVILAAGLVAVSTNGAVCWLGSAPRKLAALERYAAARRDAALRGLPEGGCVFGLDPREQLVSGTHGMIEVSLTDLFDPRVLDRTTPDELAQWLVGTVAEKLEAEPVLWTGEGLKLLGERPFAAPYLAAMGDALDSRFELQPVGSDSPMARVLLRKADMDPSAEAIEPARETP